MFQPDKKMASGLSPRATARLVCVLLRRTQLSLVLLQFVFTTTYYLYIQAMHALKTPNLFSKLTNVVQRLEQYPVATQLFCLGGMIIPSSEEYVPVYKWPASYLRGSV